MYIKNLFTFIWVLLDQKVKIQKHRHRTIPTNQDTQSRKLSIAIDLNVCIYEKVKPFGGTIGGTVFFFVKTCKYADASKLLECYFTWVELMGQPIALGDHRSGKSNVDCG